MRLPRWPLTRMACRVSSGYLGAPRPAGRNCDPVAGAEEASYAGAPPGARRAAERVDADEHRLRLSDGRRMGQVDLPRHLQRQVGRDASQRRMCPFASRSR